MHMDPLLPRLVAALLVVVVLATLGKRFSQPMPVVYIVAGVLLGPKGAALLDEAPTLARIGEFGVILLLFLLGTEIKLDRLLASWRVPVVGLAAQIAASLGSAAALGWALDWPVGRIVLVGFVISLSSTAVVLPMLEDRKLQDSELGNHVLSILLAQDLALAPMLIVIGLLGGGAFDPVALGLQFGVGGAMLGLLAWVARRGVLRLPFAASLRGDPDLQVFAALLAALSLALVSALAGLSAAFGAFVAGVIIGATEEERWVHSSLHPFRVVLVAVFLMAIGTLLDLGFLRDNLALVASLAGIALLTNTGVNALVLRFLGQPWRESVLGGALLSQIGEFSFVLAAIGLHVGLVNTFGYQLALSVIATTLLLSAVWIGGVGFVQGRLTPPQPA